MKINLGSSKLKSSFFPISFDSSTSSNFGECIPTFCQEVVSDSHVSIDWRSAARFAPLSLPTFGKAFLHDYAFYHKFVDLWAPYNDFLAGTPFTSSIGNSYIPTEVPSLPLSYIWFIVLSHCTWTPYSLSSTSSANAGDSPLRVSKFTLSNFVPNGNLNPTYFSYGFVATLAHVVAGETFASGLLSNSRRSNLIYGKTDAAPNRFVLSSSSDAITPAGSDFMFETDAQNIYFSASPGGSVVALSNPSSRVLICCKLNNSGKLLRKIFMGLGYQIKNVSKSVSILPLYAYFKSYFSTFAPKRYVKFEQTNFASAITSLVNTGSSFSDLLFGNNGSVVSGTHLPFASFIIDELLSCFYTEDSDFYSSQILGLSNDYGAPLSQPYLGQIAATPGDVVDIISQVPVPQSPSGIVNGASVPSIDFVNPVEGGTKPILHTQSQQNILSRLTSFVNRRSLIGGKIADLLESVFGIPTSDVLDSNPYIGSSVVEVNFSDVFSTAETSEGSLGEYAGRAMGIGSSDNLSVKCSSPGLVVAFSCLVPRTQKVQGVNPCLFHINRYDYYNPMFDGLTLLPTSRYSLYCVDSFDDVRLSNDTFGMQSLFAEYKTKTQGILNGDLSLLSTKSTYDSFTMDQTLANYVYQKSNDGSLDITLTSPNVSSCVAGTMWRYIGRWLWLGNYDRIFINQRQTFDTVPGDFSNLLWNVRDTRVTDDNLIVHNVIDLRINAPMLPLADSYMTRDLDELNNSVGVRSQSE